jgi:hypothetical protein
VPPNRLGVAYEDVKFTTSDGLRLKGWYVPSRNGATVIAFPGRRGPQKHTRMLARHGYGVLLFDRRGEGKSEGDPNSWGWGGGKDIKAAIAATSASPSASTLATSSPEHGPRSPASPSLRRPPPPGWIGVLGIVIGPVLMLCSLEFVGRHEPTGWKLAERLTPITYIAWSLWLIATGIALLA